MYDGQHLRPSASLGTFQPTGASPATPFRLHPSSLGLSHCKGQLVLAMLFYARVVNQPYKECRSWTQPIRNRHVVLLLLPKEATKSLQLIYKDVAFHSELFNVHRSSI